MEDTFILAYLGYMAFDLTNNIILATNHLDIADSFNYSILNYSLYYNLYKYENVQ